MTAAPDAIRGPAPDHCDKGPASRPTRVTAKPKLRKNKIKASGSLKI